MSAPGTWRAYVQRRGFGEIEVLGEIIRSWSPTRIPSDPDRPNTPRDVDRDQEQLRDRIVSACDALEARQRERRRGASVGSAAR